MNKKIIALTLACVLAITGQAFCGFWDNITGAASSAVEGASRTAASAVEGASETATTAIGGAERVTTQTLDSTGELFDHDHDHDDAALVGHYHYDGYNDEIDGAFDAGKSDVDKTLEDIGEEYGDDFDSQEYIM